MKNKSRLLITILTGLFLTACASTDKGGVTIDSTPVTPTTSSDNGSSGGVKVDPSLNNAFGTGLSLQQLKNLGITDNPLNYKVVYFQYNSSSMDQRSRVIASAHARHLQALSSARVTLEGHADERGTRDYNLALGERRAQKVANWMKTEGASKPINTISYGEERPVNTAQNDSAWSQNRRVVISY